MSECTAKVNITKGFENDDEGLLTYICTFMECKLELIKCKYGLSARGTERSESLLLVLLLMLLLTFGLLDPSRAFI